MSNYNLIEAYLDNEMSAEERRNFEQQLSENSELKQELGFQQELVAGIQEARRMELKAMLDAVSISGGSSVGGSALVGKIVVGLMLVGAITAGIYYFPGQEAVREYLPVADNHSEESYDDLVNLPAEEVESVEDAEEQAEPADATSSSSQLDQVTEEEPMTEVKVKEESPVVTKPNIRTPETIAAFDREEEALDSMHVPGNTRTEEKEPSMATIDVTVDNTRKKYTFHYQLKGGKLFLYGDFSSGLYEILEFNARKGKTLFLYFDGKYYDLNDDQERIVKLVPVKEKSLIEKLEEVRRD